MAGKNLQAVLDAWKAAGSPVIVRRPDGTREEVLMKEVWHDTFAGIEWVELFSQFQLPFEPQNSPIVITGWTESIELAAQ